jgi:hypothetical protein
MRNTFDGTRGNRMRHRLRWALIAGALLGLLWTAAMLPLLATLIDRKAGGGGSWVQYLYELSMRLPRVMIWQGGVNLSSGTGACVLIVSATCLLLLVAGGRANAGVALVGLAWFGYVTATFGLGGYWTVRVAQSGSITPLLMMTAASAIIAPLVSFRAFVAARGLSSTGKTA